MSGFGMQDALVALVALAAAAYLVRRRMRAKPEACEGCPSAPVEGARPAPEGTMLLAIGEPQRVEKRP